MTELLILISDDGTKREVIAKPMSIGTIEFYQAAATNYRPEMKFSLSDYLDYDGETFVKHGDALYRVIRTYRTGHELELTLSQASAEEVEVYG